MTSPSEALTNSIINTIVYVHSLTSKNKRDYIGISSIGSPCMRKIWYGSRSDYEAVFPKSSILKINDGVKAEAYVGNMLRIFDKDILSRQQESVGNDFIKGHIDGVVHIQGSDYVWEHKQTGDSSFKRFVKLCLLDAESALYDWNTTYHMQAQLYMHFLGIHEHLTTVGTGGLRDIHCVLTKYDEETALVGIERARMVSQMEEAPSKVSDDPNFYLCNMCGFKEICHAA